MSVVIEQIAATWDRELAEAIGILTPAELRERDRLARRAKRRFWGRQAGASEHSPEVDAPAATAQRRASPRGSDESREGQGGATAPPALTRAGREGSGA